MRTPPPRGISLGYPSKYFQISFSSCNAMWLQQRARAHGVTAEIWHQPMQGDAPGAARPSCKAPVPKIPLPTGLLQPGPHGSPAAALAQGKGN